MSWTAATRSAAITALALGALVPAASAQTGFGASVGFSQSSVIGPSSEIGTAGGWTAGLFMELPIRNALSARPSVHYAQKGARVGRRSGTLAITWENWSYDYLDFSVPVYARVHSADGRSSAGIFAGPLFAVQLDALITYEDGRADYFGTNLRQTDVGLALGAVLEFHPWFLELRYHGLGQDVSESGRGIRHGWMAVTGGYSIR